MGFNRLSWTFSFRSKQIDYIFKERLLEIQCEELQSLHDYIPAFEKKIDTAGGVFRGVRLARGLVPESCNLLRTERGEREASVALNHLNGIRPTNK